jgi:hypothetical protein
MTSRAVGRHIGAASLAGIVAGMLVSGVLGRVAMRVVALTSAPELIGVETSNGNRVGDITVGGTAALAVFVGIVAGLAGGVLYASAEPWLRPRRWKGVLFGAALLAGLGFAVLDPTNFDFKRFGFAPLNVAMFAAMFVAFGAVLAWLFDRIHGALGGIGPAASALRLVAGLTVVAAAALSTATFVSFGGLDALVPSALFAVVVLIPPIVRWRGLPRSVAYAAFGVPVLAGAQRTITALGQLLG